MVYRCFRVSLHLAKEALVKGDREMINLVTEISETIGTSLYGELQFSTSFGYPMGCMLDKTKYQLAKKSLVCFQYAIDIQATDTGEITSRVVPLWQLYFMKGKVCLMVFIIFLYYYLSIFASLNFRITIEFFKSARKKWVVLFGKKSRQKMEKPAVHMKN